MTGCDNPDGGGVGRQEIGGNTYPVRAALRALGGTWDAERRVWIVPSERAAEARALVSNAPRVRYRPTRCSECGVRAGRYTRIYGYTDATALCGPCYGDRREGD